MRPAYHQMVASAATITANGPIGTAWQAMSNARRKNVLVLLRIANAPTGSTPSLTVSLQGGPDGVNFATIASMPAQTTATPAGTVVRLLVTDCEDPYLQVSATVGGTTPSFTGVSVDLFESNDDI